MIIVAIKRCDGGESLSHAGWVVEQALNRFESERWIERLEDSEGDIIRVVPESRITMEYYKNGLIHFMAPISLLASAILANENQCHGDETLRLFLELSFVLRFEFPAHPTQTLYEVAQYARESMVDYGALSHQVAADSINDRKYQLESILLLNELAALTANFVESYMCVLKGVESLKDRTLSEKELLKKNTRVWQGAIGCRRDSSTRILIQCELGQCHQGI